MSFLDRIFKRRKIEVNDSKVLELELPCWADEQFKEMSEFIIKNNEDGLSTQILLENGRSIILSKDNDLAHESRSSWIYIMDKERNDLVMIYMNNIVGLARIPKGKSRVCD